MSRDKFWDEMAKVRAGMLSAGAARHVPMSPYHDEERASVWFIGAAGTDLAKALEAGESDASFIVSDAGGVYMRIEGRAALSNDRAKLKELWNPIAASWFDGIDDPAIRLMRLEPKAAEVWLTGGSLKFLYEIARNKLTGATPDMGEHFSVSF